MLRGEILLEGTFAAMNVLKVGAAVGAVTGNRRISHSKISFSLNVVRIPCAGLLCVCTIAQGRTTKSPQRFLFENRPCPVAVGALGFGDIRITSSLFAFQNIVL